MATMATYRAIDPVSIVNGPTANAAIPRGARCVLVPADGVNAVALAGSTVRGDYVAMQDIAVGASGSAVRLQNGEIVGLAAAVTIAAGDAIYSAANGTFTNVSTSAVLMGKAREAAASGTLFGILIETVA